MKNLNTFLRHHLESELTGDSKLLPHVGGLVWQWFRNLHATRTYDMAGANPISFAEIEAYARLYRWPLEPRHVDMIMAMDRAWLAWARAGADGLPRTTQTITADAFDAVFG